MTTNRLLRRDEVLALTGMSNTTLRRLMADGRFLKALRISTRVVRWSEVMNDNMAPQRPEPARGNRKAKPVLDIPEPELTAMLKHYCDLRRRGFSQTEIRTKLQLKRHQPSLLLAEAAERGMPSSQRARPTPSPNACSPCSTAASTARPSGECPPSLTEGTNKGSNAPWTTPAEPAQRPHHPKVRRHPRPSVVDRAQRTAHAPGLRWRVPSPLPTGRCHRAMPRGVCAADRRPGPSRPPTRPHDADHGRGWPPHLRLRRRTNGEPNPGLTRHGRRRQNTPSC